jgi:hypothetical protein
MNRLDGIQLHPWPVVVRGGGFIFSRRLDAVTGTLHLSRIFDTVVKFPVDQGLSPV